MLLINNSLVEEIQDSAASSIRGGFTTADFNGDGFSDIFVVRKSAFNNSLTWFADYSSPDGSADLAVSYGSIGDMPFIGDFNADGLTDLGLARINSNGIWEFEIDTDRNGTSDIGPFLFGSGATDLFIL